jgi:GTP:adenosylcobinamide-phosphate guanylyltransferase
MNIDVILPAGGRIEGEFAVECGTEIKALLSINGQTILERTLDALHATGRIGKIVVIGPQELDDHASTIRADVVLPEGKTGPDNIFQGLDWLREHALENKDKPRHTLILTTDLPFITPSSITTFLDSCRSDADICVPIVEKKEFESCYPNSPNFYVRLRDGEWTLGCAFLLDPQAIQDHKPSIERVFEARKSQIKMARLLGPLFILRLLTRQLRVNDIAQKCEQILGCQGDAILGVAPELAFDIDLPEEYRYAVKYKP